MFSKNISTSKKRVKLKKTKGDTKSSFKLLIEGSESKDDGPATERRLVPKREELYLVDGPKRIEKPKITQSFRNVFDVCRHVYFDESKASFSTVIQYQLAKDKVLGSEYLIQMELLKTQPWIKYGCLGFQFDEKHMDSILAVESMEFDKAMALWDYAHVKLKSITALQCISVGKLGQAKDTLAEVESKVVFMTDCDMTAWFYVAKFWFLIKELRSLQIGPEEMNSYKTMILHQLRRARNAFVVEGKLFAWESALTLWWLFLAHGELAFYAFDGKEVKLGIPESPRKIPIEERKEAEACLEKFQSESKVLDVFPKDDDSQQQLVRVFRRLMFEDKEGASIGRESEHHTDTEYLEDRYSDFIELTDGKLPSCVEQTMMCVPESKIYIYTLSDDSKEFEDFKSLIDYENNIHLFVIEKTGPIAYLAGSEGKTNIRVWKEITPGGVVLAVLEEHIEKLPRDLDTFYEGETFNQFRNKHFEIKNWTLGFLAKDKNDNKFLVTCCHNVPRIEAMPTLAFISAYEHSLGPNKVEKVIKPICSANYEGFFGTHKTEPRKPGDLIDILLLPVDAAFISSKHVNLTLTEKDIPLEMDIYEGDMKDLQGLNVSLRSCMSSFQDGTGKIVATDLGTVNVYGHHGAGLFGVAFDDSGIEGDTSQVRFGKEGDSGGLVYGFHPRDPTKRIAIGLILGKKVAAVRDPKTGKVYHNVTYCTRLSTAKSYVENVFEKEIEYFVPNHEVDSGFSSSRSLEKGNSLETSGEMNPSELSQHIKEGVTPPIEQEIVRPKSPNRKTGSKKKILKKTKAVQKQPSNVSTSSASSGPLVLKESNSKRKKLPTVRKLFARLKGKQKKPSVFGVSFTGGKPAKNTKSESEKNLPRAKIEDYDASSEDEIDQFRKKRNSLTWPPSCNKLTRLTQSMDMLSHVNM